MQVSLATVRVHVCTWSLTFCSLGLTLCIYCNNQIISGVSTGCWEWSFVWTVCFWVVLEKTFCLYVWPCDRLKSYGILLDWLGARCRHCVCMCVCVCVCVCVWKEERKKRKKLYWESIMTVEVHVWWTWLSSSFTLRRQNNFEFPASKRQQMYICLPSLAWLWEFWRLFFCVGTHMWCSKLVSCVHQRNWIYLEKDRLPIFGTPLGEVTPELNSLISNVLAFFQNLQAFSTRFPQNVTKEWIIFSPKIRCWERVCLGSQKQKLNLACVTSSSYSVCTQKSCTCGTHWVNYACKIMHDCSHCAPHTAYRRGLRWEWPVMFISGRGL